MSILWNFYYSSLFGVIYLIDLFLFLWIIMLLFYFYLLDMNRPYKVFKDKWIGKRIDYDWAYWYQCVDLIKQYADEVLWLWRIWALWNANKVQNSSTFKSFSKLWVKDLIQWDIIIRTKWKYWHIAIVDHILNWRVYVLEQNGSWKNSWNGLGENAIRVKKRENYSEFWKWIVGC